MRVNAQWHRWRSLTAASLHVTTGNHTLNINGLAPGTVVLVTETLSGGHISISVTLPAGTPGPRGGGQQEPEQRARRSERRSAHRQRR